MKAIEFKELKYIYKGANKAALKNVSFTVEKGEIILLTGESGCGKSTLTRLINGLAFKFGADNICGDVLLEGMSVKDIPIWELASRVGSVFQNPKSQFFNSDVANEIVFTMENLGASRDDMQQALERVSKSCCISQLLGNNIFDLSGGEKQKIAFAAACSPDPDIYVLDEPSANLDIKSIRDIGDILKDLKDRGKTVLLAEHRYWWALDYIDKVFYMKDGYLNRILSADEFKALSGEQLHEMGLRAKEKGTLSICNDIETANAESNGLEIKNISYKYKGNYLWKDVSFSINEGDVIAVTGKNGKGKSTLARVMCGLLKKSNGEILYKGKVLSPKQQRQMTFLIMQDVNAQLFSDSVINEVMTGNAADKKKAVEVLEKMNLGGLEERHPLSLSGGQKQRLAICDGVLCGKTVLIFDEPTSGLDYRNMLSVGRIIKELAAEGMCIMIITHDDEFIKACDAKVINWNGEL